MTDTAFVEVNARHQRVLETAAALLALQDDTLDGWGRLNSLLAEYHEASLIERAALSDEFDELTANMLANAEHLREIIIRYHRPE